MTGANDNRDEVGRIESPGGDLLVVSRGEGGPFVEFHITRDGQLYRIANRFSDRTAEKLIRLLREAMT